MQWIARVFACAVIRKLAYVFVAFALLGIGKCAHAQDYSKCTVVSSTDGTCASRSDAEMYAQQAAQYGKGVNQMCGPFITVNAGTNNGGNVRYYVRSSGCADGNGTLYRRIWTGSSAACQPGEWLNPSGTECLSMNKCLALNPGLGDSSGVRYFDSAASNTCNGGCAMDFVTGTRGDPKKTVLYVPNADGVTFTPQSKIAYSGNYEYTGYGCGLNAPAVSPAKDAPAQTDSNKPKKTQDCIPVGNLTQCAKPDGTMCTSVSGTKSICWKPGEVGTKTQDAVMQKSSPGKAQQPSSVALSNGDTATKTGEVAVSTTINNSTSNTTITNYTTASGANAGSSNDGQASDGSDTGDGKDKDGNSAGGGGDCAAPPSCSGDAIMCAQLNQQWLQRCSNDKNNNGQPDWTEPKDGDGKLADDGKDGTPGVRTGTVSASLLDMGGFGGGGSCPSLGTISIEPFGSFNLDEHDWVCSLVACIHAVMLLLAVVIPIRILMS